MNIDFFNRWCVESPLNPSTEKNPIKSDRKESKDNNTFNENSRYSQLHYSLLESMLERTSLQNQLLLLQVEVISPRHLVALVKGLSNTLAKNAAETSSIQLTLDRLAQAIQVAQSSECLYGNIRKFYTVFMFYSQLTEVVYLILDDLMQLLRTLPYNRLLDIVVRRYS